MIPIALVTGFLGSGKSSLLRALAQRFKNQRWAWLINEFGAVDVDGRRLEESLDRVVPLPGGSIFCTCLAATFANTLHELPQRFPHITGLVIEASGMANPAVVDQLITDLHLNDTYALRSVITVIDPGSFTVLLQTLPNIKDQAACADLLLINKTDLFEEAPLAEVERRLRQLNPGAPLLRCTHGAADFDPFEIRHTQKAGGEYAQCIDPNFRKASIRFKAPQRLAPLCQALEALGPALYRAKGFVPTPQGPVFLDYCLGQSQHYPVEDAAPPFELVLIAKGPAADALAQWMKQVKSGCFEAP